MVKETVYLGLTITEYLDWDKHIEQKLAACKRKLFAFKRLIKPNWGPPQKAMKWVYTGIVRPSLTYGSLIWGRKVEKNLKIKTELQKMQALATTHFGLFRKNTPRKCLDVILGIEPLHLFIEKEMLNSANRNSSHLIQLRETYPYAKPSTLVSTLIKKLNLLGIPTDPIMKDKINRNKN